MKLAPVPAVVPVPAQYHYQIKFVIDVPADCQEVDAYLADFPQVDRYRVPPMPQGTDAPSLAGQNRVARAALLATAASASARGGRSSGTGATARNLRCGRAYVARIRADVGMIYVTRGGPICAPIRSSEM